MTTSLRSVGAMIGAPDPARIPVNAKPADHVGDTAMTSQQLLNEQRQLRADFYRRRGQTIPATSTRATA